MADDKNIDPSAQFQDYVTQWERSVDKFYNDFMGTEQYSQSMNQFQKLQLELQTRFKEAMSDQLVNVNIPNRDDVLRIGEDVRMLADRFSRLEEKLDRLLDNKGQDTAVKRDSPPRTKTPTPKTDTSATPSAATSPATKE